MGDSFSYAFIIFRELMEIVILVNLTNLNFHYIKDIRKITILAIIFALIGGVIFLFSLKSLSNFLTPVFDQIFEAAISFISGCCILYNLISKFGKIEKSNKISLGFALFSTIFREISEIILLSWTLISKMSLDKIILNFCAGFIPSLIIGILITKNIKPLKTVFKITNIIFLIIGSNFISKSIKLVFEITDSDLISQFNLDFPIFALPFLHEIQIIDAIFYILISIFIYFYKK